MNQGIIISCYTMKYLHFMKFINTTFFTKYVTVSFGKSSHIQTKLSDFLTPNVNTSIEIKGSFT